MRFVRYAFFCIHFGFLLTFELSQQSFQKAFNELNEPNDNDFNLVEFEDDADMNDMNLEDNFDIFCDMSKLKSFVFLKKC